MKLPPPARGGSCADETTIPPVTTPQPGFATWFRPIGLFTLTGTVAVPGFLRAQAVRRWVAYVLRRSNSSR